MKKDEESPLRKLGLFMVIVGDLVGYTGVGTALGYLAWTKAGAPWVVLLLGATAGLGLAFYKIYKIGRNL
ncbi:MAG: hypothetical protein HYX41_02540 [Bdellovibrio sp.]|nr:hypothetical protein [Bdellovibrio sp.]